MILSSSLQALLRELEEQHACCRLILRAYKRTLSGRKTRLLNPSPIGDFFTYRENEGQITFCPAGRTQGINENGSWKREGRQGIKPAKWLKAMLHPRIASRIPDHIIGAFATSFKAAESAAQITFQETSEINTAYNEEKWPKDKPGSCMWDSNVEEFYSLYNVTILTAHQHGKHVARAIVWHECRIRGADSTVSVMDRIYATSPEVEELMKREAKTRGYWHKTRQNNSAMRDFTLPDGSQETHYLSVKPLARWNDDCSFWPYLDTFRWLDTSDGELTNDAHSPDENEGWAELCDTGGGREINDHAGQVQDVNGEWIDEGDAVSVNGDYYHYESDSIVTCHRSGEYILRDDAYEIDLSRNETIYIHEDYVSRA